MRAERSGEDLQTAPFLVPQHTKFCPESSDTPSLHSLNAAK